jgi:hypothetical protein
MEIELDMSQDELELEERIAIIASDEDVKLVCYKKSRRVVVKVKGGNEIGSE